MLDRSAKGVFVIAPTPFLPDGALDLASTDRMTDAFIAAGASGMTILGVMGEAPKLTEAESLSFVDRVLKRVAGRIPVVVGASAPGFAQMKAIARGSLDLGVHRDSTLNETNDYTALWTEQFLSLMRFGPESRKITVDVRVTGETYNFLDITTPTP